MDIKTRDLPSSRFCLARKESVRVDELHGISIRRSLKIIDHSPGVAKHADTKMEKGGTLPHSDEGFYAHTLCRVKEVVYISGPSRPDGFECR